MTALITTTTQVRVAPQFIPADVVAVTWRRTEGNVWHYRFHATERGAKIAHGKNSRAYDRSTYVEWGWKIIGDIERETGVWLW